MIKKAPSTLNIILIFAAMVMFFLLFAKTTNQVVQEVPYSQFKTLINEDQVKAVEFSGQDISVSLNKPIPAGSNGATTDNVKTRMPDIDDPALLPLLEKKNIRISDKPPANTSWLIAWLPWIAIIGFYLWFQSRIYRRNMGGLGGGGPGDFLGGSANEEVQGPPAVTFDDVAGQAGAKQEVAELVTFLKDPDQYRTLGAEPPHGVLLVGPPGTGKTLLARALAGEAGVPFFSTSASEFIEMFVGVGASRVRKLFDQAKAKAPSIIFIDELDSIGRVRGAGLGGGHDEREQTLNQILAEMDGFAGHEAVIVLAATNRPDVLDPALLRPGRFDRHVTLDLPDRPAREAILRLHTRQVPLDPEVDLGRVAAGTVGFSGADLKNLVNEAAMHAAREHRERVADEDFESMRDKVMLGSERTLAIQPEERHRLAVHESGHTLVAHYLPQADALHKVSIIPRGRALGATQQLPEEDRYTLPEEYLRDRLTVMLGGRSAERLVLGSVSSGADDDIHQATNLARAMVARWGMSDDIGPVDLRDSDEHPFLGREMAQPRHHSEATAKAVDGAVGKLLHEAQVQAEGLITQHRAALDRLVAELERKETLYREDIARILGGRTGETPAVARG
jgi:cell division protease FtsH